MFDSILDLTPLVRGAFSPWGGLRGAVTAWAMPVGLVPGGSYRAGLAIREHPDKMLLKTRATASLNLSWTLDIVLKSI